MPRLHGCTLASKALLSGHGFWSGLCTVVVPFKCLLIAAQIDSTLYRKLVQVVTFVGWMHFLVTG